MSKTYKCDYSDKTFDTYNAKMIHRINCDECKFMNEFSKNTHIFDPMLEIITDITRTVILDSEDINMSCCILNLNDNKVLFYEPTKQIIKSSPIDEYLENMTVKAIEVYKIIVQNKALQTEDDAETIEMNLDLKLFLQITKKILTYPTLSEFKYKIFNQIIKNLHENKGRAIEMWGNKNFEYKYLTTLEN